MDCITNRRISRRKRALPVANHAWRLRDFRCSPTAATISNPYEPPITTQRGFATIRAVRRYLLGSATLLVFAITVGMAGLQLLNQEHDWIPTQSAIYDIEIFGQPVSNATAIRYSIGASVAFYTVGVLLGLMALYNWRHNRGIGVDDSAKRDEQRGSLSG